jgi:hypothetical protein
MTLLFAELIDVGALAQSAAFSLVAGIWVMVAFSLAIYGSTRLGEARAAGHRGLTVAWGAVAATGIVCALGTAAFGIYVMAFT